MTDQVRMKTLLQDPLYRQWITRIPVAGQANPKGEPYNQRPWRVFVQVTDGGPWGIKDFRTYKKALAFMFSWIKRGCWDTTISHKVHAFGPPAIRIPKVKTIVDKKTGKATKKKIMVRRVWPGTRTEGHLWCPHCRRPTVFKYFTKHHVLSRHVQVIPYIRRCTICGIKEDAIRRY